MEFKNFKVAMQKQFKKMTTGNNRLFVVEMEKDELWNTYLDSFPEGTNPIYKEKREFDCNACKSFIRHYGKIATLKNNKLVSIWDIPEVEYPFNIIAKKMSKLVKSKSIDTKFVTDIRDLGTDSNITEDLHTWHHFYFELPKSFPLTLSGSINADQANYRTRKQVFERSMRELTIDAAETVLDLISQGSLYRGEEFKKVIKEFIVYKKDHDKLEEITKENWYWLHCECNVARIRNTAVGTILVDLSEDMDLNQAVSRWEKVMAPTNYKRPNGIFTKKMKDEAEKKVIELGYENSLNRKFAVLEDVSIDDVLFANRDVKQKMTGSLFDELDNDIVVNPQKFDKVEEIEIEDFIRDVLPNTTSIKMLVENKHMGNFMSLISPENKEAPSMLKWGNNFSWSYKGDITDSIKQRVKAAGGNVDGVLRFSIQWNDKEHNPNDFDAHCIEPCGNKIHFANQKNESTSGFLDVDIIHPKNGVPAVENIAWTDIKKMKNGKYKFRVHNYSHRGGTSGFDAEIEYDGQIHRYSYPNELKQDELVYVAEIEFDKDEGIKFIRSLESSVSSKDMWGIKTNQFVPVSVFMLSPNYWNDKQEGNKHYFFFLNGCANNENPRGFYNEFLDLKLMEHKRVFEALSAKMKVEYSDSQLSGLGFSSTQRNDVIVEVSGRFNRKLKIKF